MQAQEEDTPRGDLNVEGTSTEIAQPAIETQADDTEAQNANKDQPVGDEHESRVVAEAPLVGTESTAMKAPPVTEAQPVDDGAGIANIDRPSGDEIWSIDESQPVGSEPPSVEAQSTIEAQPAAKALPVIEEEPVSESQSQNDTAIITTPKKNKKKKNRKSVTFDVGSETLAETEQAGPSMNESDTTSALVTEDKSTIQSEVLPPFETPAEDHERRADLEPVPVLVAAHDQQTIVPMEGAKIDNEISASTEPDAGLASNSRRDPLLASLADEDEKCIGQTEELPLISDTQEVPSTSQSTLQQSEPQPVPSPAEIEPSTSSPSKKAKKKKSRKSLALEPEASREISGPETQTLIINEPITTLEENVPGKTVGRDILTPDFVDALSTPPVDSTQTKSSEQDILTPDFVDAPSSLPMDTSMADNAVQDSTVQVAPAEAPMSKDTEVAIPPMSTEEEKPTEKEIEFTSAAEATTPIIEDKPKEEEVQLTPTVSNPPSPVSKKSKKKKAKKSSASQPEESISTSTQDTPDLSTDLPASASATDNAIEPSLTVPSQPETSVLDGLNATEEKQSNEASADIGAEPIIVEPQTAQEQALPDEPIVQSLTREAHKAAEQGLPDQATVQPPTEEPQSSTQTSVPDELVPNSPTSTKNKKKKKGKKTQSVDTAPQDLSSIIPQNGTEVARPTTPTEESAGDALEDKVDQQTQEPSTLKLQPTEIMDNTPAGDHFQEQTTINSQPMQVDVAEKVTVDQEPQEQDTTELQPTQVEAVEKELADQHLQEQTAVESQPVIGENSVGETASESVVPIKKSKKKKNKKSQSTIEPTSDSLVPSINEPLQDVTVADAPNQPQPDETSRSAALPSADVPKPDDARPAESVPLGESFPVTTVPTSATHQSAPEPDYLPSAPAVYVRPMDSVGAPREEIYFPSALSMLPAARALQGHRYPAQAQAETKSSEQQGPPSELEELEEGKNVPEEPHSWAEDSDRRGEPGELGTEALRTTPAPAHATTGFDGPDLSQGKSTEPTVAEEVEGAPAQARTQPDLFSGEEELQRDPGRLGLADPPPDPLTSVDPAGLVRDAGDLPAQPPMAVGENDAPAGDITDPSITPSTQDGPKNSIDISDVKEDSGGSKKGKKNKKKKRQSATESLDPQPEAPSRAIEPVEEPLSQTSPSVEHPIEPEPIAVTQEPSSSIEDQQVERLDIVDADGAASMAKKAKKSQKDSQVLDDLGETAPSVEEPMTESAKDDAVTTQEDAASESTPASMTGADEVQPEKEWAPVKKSKKDKKKNKASSVPLDTEVPSEPTTVAEDPLLEPAASTEPPVNVDDQATKDESSFREVVADDEWSAIQPKESKKKKARTSLADEGEDKSTDVAAEPTPEAEVPLPSEEVVKPEDDVDAAPATPKKSKKDKKKRKSVAFADSAEEQPMGSLEKAQDGVASSDPTDEPAPVDSEVKPEPAVLSDVPTGKSSSSGPLENKDDQAWSVPSSEPLEVPNSGPDESTSQATIDRDVSGVSPDEEFTAVTKKSKKDKKKAKKKSQEQELDATAPEMPAALDETASTTGQHTEIHRDIGNSSAVTQDETTPEQAIAETTVLDEPKQVKAESIVEVPSERPQSPSAEPEAVDKQSTDTRDLPSQDSSNIEQTIGHSTETPAEQPEEQPVQTHDDEFTVVPTKKSKKDKKKKKSSQAQLQDSSSVETPTEQQSFLAPGQPSEKEPSATEPWVTEDIAGPSEEQPVEEHNDQDGTIVADKSTLKAGLETSEVAHEASSTLAEPASVGSNITTVPELQAASEDQTKEDTLQLDRDLPEQTNTLDTVAEDEWGISSPAKSKKDKKKKKKGAELTSEEQLIAPIEEASAPSPLVDAPVEAPLLEGATPDQSIAPSLEDKSGPSEELSVSDRPKPEVVSPKKSKDKKKKKQTSSWEDELGELPTPAENEPAALPSDTAPQQVDEVVVAEASPEEHKGADVLSTDEKKDGSLSEPAVDAPLDEPKEDIPEYFAPVKKSKKDKKKKRQASPWEDEVPQGTAPEPSEMASTVVEEPPSQPSETVGEPANHPVEEGVLPIDETQKDEEANREGLGQHPPVSGEFLDIEAVEATPALDDVQREAPADKEVESKQALGTPLATESDTKKVAEDASPEYTSSKKSKKEKRKKRAAQLHDDLENVPVMAVEESAPIQNPRDAPLAAGETVPEAVVSEEGPKELDVKNPPEEITAEEDLPVTDRLNTETELPEPAVFKKSKTDKKASREQDEREPLPSSPPTGAEPSTAQAQGHVDIPIHSEKLPNLTNEPMPEELFKEPLAEQQSVPEEQPALQEHTLPQDASVSEEPLTDPTLESTVTKDSTVPSDDLADKKGSDTITATPQELVDQPRELVHSLGDRTTGLSEGGQPTPDQASANNLATELRVDAPTQPQVEDTMTSRLPIRVLSREVQSPASAVTTDESARASHQSQKQEDAIEVTERELQSDVPSEQPVDGAKSKEDKKKGKANFKLDLERILSRQVTSRQVPANPKGAQREVTEPKQIDPSEELPATPAAAEWADHGATKKDTAILETEPASRKQMPDTQHSLATHDIVANDDTAKALLPKPATDDLIPNEPTDSEGAAATSKRGRGDKKRKSSVLPETEPEPVAEHAPSDESVSLGVENDEAVSRGALTGPMMIDQPQADAPTSTELAPTQPTSTEVEMANPTPATPERATSQHRQVSGPVDVDLSPAQLSSHIDHEPPFDQSTQPGKKVRMQSFLDDAVIPEPISATPEPTPEPVREPTPEPMPEPVREPTPEPTPSHLEHPTPEAEASSPSKTVLDDNTQRREVPQSDSMAREFAALYFDQPASGEKSRSRPRRAPRGQGMPNLDMKYNTLPILTPQRDLAVSYFEKGPGNRQKSAQGDRDTSTEDVQRGTDEAEALLAASALAGGVEKMTEQFGSSKKTKTKDKKKSENTGRGTSQEEDIHTPNTITANTEDKTDNRSATSLLRLVEDATSDSPESPIVGRGQKTGSATDRSFLSKESMQESKDLQDSQNSELIRDIEELDTSEPQAQSSPGPMPSHDMADFGRRSTMSMRSLPPVEEETHEELEDDLRHESQPGQALRSPEINRDSGFMADSPNPMRHGQFEDDTQRDSGVHLRDWADNSFTRRREGLSTLDEGARLSWASTDSRSTPKSEERRLKKSPLGDDAPPPQPILGTQWI
ncbi:involucrin repeat protein [Apiospora rasikravindrae]|uniref:Involucrin repeat protein n=1 Tax=Apiospora rasikravindrae TaxID=990691 RepID=A0ABR1T6S8_9PEZI